MAISAQPTPSKRMLQSCYCASLADLPDYLPYEGNEHEQEINFSHLGTVEFRVFDTNIPQCSLAEAWILKKICDHIRVNDKTTDLNFRVDRYVNLRKLACCQGFTSLPITELLTQIKTMLPEENLDVFELDSIRDIFYLMAKYALNPSDIYHIVKPSKYAYFKTMFEEPNKYLENLKLVSGKFINVFDKMLNESKQITSFDQLIALSTHAPNTKLFEAKKKIKQIKPLIDLEFLKNKIAYKHYDIKRIVDYENINSEDIAIEISNMMIEEPTQLVNRMSTQEILEAHERFYTFSINDDRIEGKRKTEFLGAIALRFKTGEIMHMIVNKNYQKLGIGSIMLKYLVDFTKDTALPEAIAYIKKSNTVSAKMFEKLGFKKGLAESPTADRYFLNTEEAI